MARLISDRTSKVVGILRSNAPIADVGEREEPHLDNIYEGRVGRRMRAALKRGFGRRCVRDECSQTSVYSSQRV